MGTARKTKPSEQQKTKIFNDNIRKLKEGFLKLPQMKREVKPVSKKKEK